MKSTPGSVGGVGVVIAVDFVVAVAAFAAIGVTVVVAVVSAVAVAAFATISRTRTASP